MKDQQVYERFVQIAPAAVMVEGLLCSCFDPDAIDQTVAPHLGNSCRRNVCFSHLVALLLPVVFQTCSSIRHAFRQDSSLQATASLQCFYQRLNHTPISALSAWLDSVVQRILPLFDPPAPLDPLVKRRFTLDGNHLAATQRRLAGMRDLPAPLPGQALILRCQHTGLFLKMLPWEDAHTNERLLFPKILDWFQAGDAVIADCSFCTETFLAGLMARQAFFVVRHHGSVGLSRIGERLECGRCESGVVFESTVTYAQTEIKMRCIEVELSKPTRSGQQVVRVLTNLPAESYDGLAVAKWYLERRTIEKAFQELAEGVRGEVETLAQPKGALLAFTVSVVVYNLLQVVRRTAERVQEAATSQEKASEPDQRVESAKAGQGEEEVKKQPELSPVLIGQEVATYGAGVEVALAGHEEMPTGSWPVEQLRGWLEDLAKRLLGGKYDKSRRSSHRRTRKKKSGRHARGKHTSTARFRSSDQPPTKSQ